MNAMTLAILTAGDRDWILPAALIGAAGVVFAVWLNRSRLRRLPGGPWLRCVGWLLLAICLVNPLWTSSRPRRGANVLAVVADTSRSHLVSADGRETTRADVFTDLIQAGENSETSGWLNRLAQDFELKRYVVADRLRQVRQFGRPDFDGVASGLQTALRQIGDRFRGQALAGVVLLTDGNATDLQSESVAWDELPPVYIVVPPDNARLPDVAVDTVMVTQSSFDDAPVSLQVQAATAGVADQRVRFTLQDAAGVTLESQTRAAGDDAPVRFRHRPDTGGTVFYRVRTELENADGTAIADEVTDVNNERLVAVDRGSQPRRILYVSGRPNWDFKFLRRAVETDPLLELVALVRIAKKEAKFDFRGREEESSNSLFRGFEETEQEVAEEYDEPVLVRLGTRDENELIAGFPEDPDALFRYDALVLDDVEAGFFLADQQKLIYDFVARRGGGFLMMGGQESFRQGEYDRTPIGKLLPVDLSRAVAFPSQPVRLTLTRDGWLQPWVRLRSDETAESLRLEDMPGFSTVNSTAFVRPGAVVMAEVEDADRNHWPALVVQRFGRGRSAALCVGDFWRWRLREGLLALRDGPSRGDVPGAREIVSPGGQANDDLSDHARACRQMMRWLVAEVPRRLDVSVNRVPELGVGAVRIRARVRGSDFEPRENVEVTIAVTSPDGRVTELSGEPADDEAGLFEVLVSASDAGPWRARVSAELIPDQDEDEETLTAETGWSSQPDQEEMRSVRINRAWADQVADATGGRVIETDEVDDLISRLNSSDVPIVELWSWPVWHQWWVFAAAVGCLVADWTLRRRRGLP